jgi:hypothetical protein
MKPRQTQTKLASAAALLVIGMVVGACSSDKSFAVVTVRTSQGELTGITQFVAYVSNGPMRESILYYPPSPLSDRDAIRLTPSETTDFSVSFSSSYAGLLKVGVEARTLNQVLGYGAAEKTIDSGHKIEMDIAIQPGAQAPIVGVDAGAGGDTGAPVSACDFVNPSACSVGQTCVVKCSGTGVPLGQCTAGGIAKDGEVCRTNQDCAPGSQCFTYACGRVCRKFCNSDADCPGGTCSRRVSCDGVSTQQRFCASNCDPRGAAKDVCQGELRCLMFNEVPTCDCTESSRTGDDGATCELTTNCKPGLMCVKTGDAAPVCRPICKRSAPDCAAGRICAELSDPRYMVWSACIPMP